MWGDHQAGSLVGAQNPPPIVQSILGAAKGRVELSPADQNSLFQHSAQVKTQKTMVGFNTSSLLGPAGPVVAARGQCSADRGQAGDQ